MAEINNYKVNDLDIGFHADGYRIDKTTSALNRYTKWNITSESNWCNPVAVCFHSLPKDGWSKSDGFDWVGME